MRLVRDHPVIKRYHVLYQDEDSAWLYMIKKSSGILKTIHGSQGLLASSIIISKGTKRFFVFIPASNIRRLRRLVNRNLENNGMIVEIREVPTDETSKPTPASGLHVPFSFVKVDILSLLTDIEREILRDAIRSGYFEWPRRQDLANLSGKHNLSKATLSYHIRRAEKKIFTLLESKYGLLETS